MFRKLIREQFYIMVLHLFYFIMEDWSFRIKKNGNFSPFYSLNAKVTPTVPNTRIVKTYQTSNTCVADIVSITHKGDVNKTVCVQIDGTTLR